MNSKTEKLPICVCGEPYVKQFALDVKVPSDGIAIAKVLAVPASACVSAVTVSEELAEVKGVLSCRVLYIDGEGARKVGRTEVDFCDQLKLPFVDARAIASVSVIDVDATRITTESVVLKCVLEAKWQVVECRTLNAMTEADEGIFTQNGILSGSVLVGTVQTRLFEEGAKEIPDLEGEPLLTESAVSVCGITSRADSFVMEASIVTDVVYRATDGQLKKTSFLTPASNEIALKGVSAQSVVNAFACIGEMTCEVQAQEGGVPTLACKWTLEVNALALNPVTYTVLTDAFSPTHELAVEKEAACGCAFSRECVTRKLDGSASLDEGLPACDSVLAVASSRVSVANVYVANGKVVAEGLASCSVLYLNKEYGTTNSVAVEIPYSTPLADGVEGCAYTVTASVLEMHASSLRAGRIDVTGEVAFAITASECACLECVSAITVGAERKTGGAGMTVYVARKDQSLWEVAKALSVTPDAVLRLNGDVTFPTREGQKIILYRQLS